MQPVWPSELSREAIPRTGDHVKERICHIITRAGGTDASKSYCVCWLEVPRASTIVRSMRLMSETEGLVSFALRESSVWRGVDSLTMQSDGQAGSAGIWDFWTTVIGMGPRSRYRLFRSRYRYQDSVQHVHLCLSRKAEVASQTSQTVLTRQKDLLFCSID